MDWKSNAEQLKLQLVSEGLLDVSNQTDKEQDTFTCFKLYESWTW